MKKIDYNTYQKPSDYVKLQAGDNRIRIVSEGVICYEHGMMQGARYIPLGVCNQTAGCEQCQKGNQPKLRYKWIVYLPEFDETRLLSVGPQIGDEICCLAAKGDPRAYDIIINRTGIGKQSRYKVSKAKESQPIEKETIRKITQTRDYLVMRHLSA